MLRVVLCCLVMKYTGEKFETKGKYPSFDYEDEKKCRGVKYADSRMILCCRVMINRK